MRSSVLAAIGVALVTLSAGAARAETGADIPEVDRGALAERFETHCFDCHGNGGEEGGLDLEKLAAGGYGDESLAKWEAVWKNLRSRTMPPADAETPTDAQYQAAVGWIESNVFRLDPEHIDPGRVVLRRLNREEYRWTIHDLLNTSYNVDEELPADDTGYGFDTIGEVLTLSPMLLEKYLAAANEIVDGVIPYGGPVDPERNLWGANWRSAPPGDLGDVIKANPPELKAFPKRDVINLDRADLLVERTWVETAGDYELRVELQDSTWAMHARAADLILRHENAALEDGSAGPSELARATLRTGLPSSERRLAGKVRLEQGHAVFGLQVRPSDKNSPKSGNPVHPPEGEYKLRRVVLVGPLNAGLSEYPQDARQAMSAGPPPNDATPGQLREKLREQTARFALKAFRRPIDDATLDRLVEIGMAEIDQPNKRYEHGVGVVYKAIISSPRFLFRAERPSPEAEPDHGVVPLDDYSLATRLSYLMHGRGPDQRLLELAEQGELRSNLEAEVDRLIEDAWRYETGVANFVGQWLQARDVFSTNFDVRRILQERDGRKASKRFNWRHQDAMKQETLKMFQYLVTEDRPAEELLTADYTFVNEPLARLYDLPKDLKDVDGKRITGHSMRRVKLPKDGRRGGLLTHGSFLIVTSNATRTSPVKRGLFVLDNLLGTPAPPAPADVPDLLDSKKGDLKHASLREILEFHRRDPLCASCHDRMDPLGLALENFNALGIWRDEEPAIPKSRWTEAEPAKPIDAAGELPTGEKFNNARELAQILATEKRDDYYRCLTEKMLVFALGRGLTYRDGPTVDAVVDRLKKENGSLRALYKGVVTSVPFTHMRADGAVRIARGDAPRRRRSSRSAAPQGSPEKTPPRRGAAE